jgi:3-oxoacyl-[acyl-carrier protein] reductase
LYLAYSSAYEAGHPRPVGKLCTTTHFFSTRMTLSGKRILLTGGSSGIGLSTAEQLAAKGAKLLITGRRADALAEVAGRIGCAYLVADMGTPEGVAATAAEALSVLGGVDVLINNAAIGEFERIEHLTWEALERVYAVNVFGVAMLTAAVVPTMKAQGKGTIVNIASTAAIKGFATGSIYSGTKFALRSMTQCWQEELRKFNIRVCQVNPSEVLTAFASPDRSARPEQENKLRGEDIGYVITSILEMDERGFVPEVSVWATNPFA